jgi:MoxR-like ATPase
MIKRLQEALTLISSVIKGKEEGTNISLATLLAGGHLLLEDLPGTGKTTLALALSKVTGCTFARVQFTSDLMPSDVVGTEIFLPQEGRFQFKPGPIFHNILLADEINRATPRTQSALLEAMGEGKVSVGGDTYPLPSPFFVIATQNPLELYGTYPLPESQLDRFMVRMEMGYPAKESETEIIAHNGHYTLAQELPSLLSPQEILDLQGEVTRVEASPKIMGYIMEITQHTRHKGQFRFGLSTRGAIALKKVAQAWAYLEGRDFLIPEDVKRAFPYVAFHRLSPPGDYGPRERLGYLLDFLTSVPVPL